MHFLVCISREICEYFNKVPGNKVKLLVSGEAYNIFFSPPYLDHPVFDLVCSGPALRICYHRDLYSWYVAFTCRWSETTCPLYTEYKTNFQQLVVKELGAITISPWRFRDPWRNETYLPGIIYIYIYILFIATCNFMFNSIRPTF